MTLTKCGDKRNGINSGIVESLVPAPNAKLKSIPVWIEHKTKKKIFR